MRERKSLFGGADVHVAHPSLIYELLVVGFVGL